MYASSINYLTGAMLGQVAVRSLQCPLGAWTAPPMQRSSVQFVVSRPLPGPCAVHDLQLLDGLAQDGDKKARLASTLAISMELAALTPPRSPWTTWADQ
eukprot:9732622-Karenia_brevis.AAC.1